MQKTLGISSGADVVCSALLSTSDDGTDSFDYRTITADDSRTDVGYLVSSSVDIVLARTDADVDCTAIDQIAVTYRTPEQARALRAAATRCEITLVPETPAILSYFRHTGEIAGHATIVVVDVGASGTTVTVVGRSDGTVHATDRTDSVGGNSFDETLLQLATARAESIGGDVRSGDRIVATARLRTAKEHLSSAPSVSIRTGVAGEITVERGEFENALGDQLQSLRRFVSSVIGRSSVTADAVAVIGGGAYVPAVLSAVGNETGLPVVRTAEPDTALAKGAALLIRSSPSGKYPLHVESVAPSTASMGRTAGVLAAALAATAFVLVYGLQVVVPSDVPGVSPAATATMQPSSAPSESRSSATQYGSVSRPEASRSVYPVAQGTSAPAAPVTPTPSLRPAPGLPSIAMPPATRTGQPAHRVPFADVSKPTFQGPITDVPQPTFPISSAPPTSAPPTSVPPTSVPPTSLPPTSVPPTSAPPTGATTPEQTSPAYTTKVLPGSSAPDPTGKAAPSGTTTTRSTGERVSPPVIDTGSAAEPTS